MPVSTGQVVTREFTLRSPGTGQAANADALPTGKLIVNGVVSAATVTIAGTGTTGVYTWTATMPTLAATDGLQTRVTATVAGVTDGADVWQDVAVVAPTGTLS